MNFLVIDGHGGRVINEREDTSSTWLFHLRDPDLHERFEMVGSHWITEEDKIPEPFIRGDT